MFQNLQKAWVLYLVTSYTVFTLPPPVFSQNSPPVPVKSSFSDVNPNSVDPNAGGAEPVVQASSILDFQDIDSLIAAASAPHRPSRKHSHPEPHPHHSHKRSSRRHPPHHPKKHGPPSPHHKKHGPPPPPRHHKKPSGPPPSRRKSSVIKSHKPVPKPFPSSSDDHDIDRHHEKHHHHDRDRSDEHDRKMRHSHHDKHDHSKHDSSRKHGRDRDIGEKNREKQLRNRNNQDQLTGPSKIIVPTSLGEYKMIESTGSDQQINHDPPHTEPEVNRSLPDEDYYAAVAPLPHQDTYYYSGERSPRASREISTIHLPAPVPAHSYEEQQAPLPWPKPAKPVQLAYYYDSNDGKDLKDLVRNHHLRRRKECDGLDNFVYDLEIIAFLLGLIAAGIGFYADVIPFFNEGVKITYGNDLGGDGDDFPHSYWPIKGATHATVHRHKRSLIKIGDLDDDQREVLSVTGEFIGVAGLLISLLGLFPHLVEKFFFSLDWWFGKRGLWKQYLYTYKCEVHPYPQPGWGR